MYGVPVDLHLDLFVGARLTQIALDEYQLQFVFQPDGHIAIEGAWQLLQSNAMVDEGRRGEAISTRKEFRLYLLLGHTVVGWTVEAPEYFSLTFDGDLALRIYDDSDCFESFSIQPGDIFV